MVTRRRVQQPRPVPPPQSLLLLVVLSLLLALVWGPPGFDAFLLQPRFTTTATSSHGRISRSSTRAHRLMQMQMPVQTPALRPFHPTADTPADALPLVDHARVRAHGRHVCLDYTGFRVDAREGAEATLAAIRAAVGESGVREVHSRVVVLGEDGLSPPGFTGVCLVDESHVTAHCYSDRGWLAIDVFTCGAHPPEVGVWVGVWFCACDWRAGPVW